MNASVVDLRYKMKDVLKALDRNEDVKIIYHGKIKGVIKPINSQVESHKITNHSFFNMTPDTDVDAEMEQLRKGRSHDI